MEKLKAQESNLIGKWEMRDGVVVQDDVCDRILWLVEFCLEEILIAGESWSALYRDQKDNRLWELIYPASHMQGGGPPTLRVISKSQAQETYQGLSDKFIKKDSEEEKGGKGGQAHLLILYWR